MRNVTKSLVSTTRITISICCPWCSYTWKQVTCFVHRLFQLVPRVGQQICMWQVLHQCCCFKAVTPYPDNSGHLAATKTLACSTCQWVTHMQKTTRALESTHPFPPDKLLATQRLVKTSFDLGVQTYHLGCRRQLGELPHCPGKELVLNYPCAFSKRVVWMGSGGYGSTLPRQHTKVQAAACHTCSGRAAGVAEAPGRSCTSCSYCTLSSVTPPQDTE